MMRKFIFLLLILASLPGYSQKMIAGIYNPVSRTYQPNEDSIWVDLFSDEYARFVTNGYMGLMDKTGKIVVQPVYDNIIDINKKFVRYMLNGKYGSLELGKKKSVNPFCYVEEFYEGIAKFSSDLSRGEKQYGFITEEGKIITPLGAANGFSDFVHGIAVRTQTGKTDVMNTSGKVQTFAGYEKVYAQPRHLDQSSLQQRIQGYVIISTEDESDKSYVDENAKYYYVNNKLERISEKYFTKASHYVKDHAAVEYEGLWYIIDKAGKLLKTAYKNMELLENGTFVVTNQKDSSGVINSSGEICIPLLYKTIEYLSDDLYAVSKLEQSTSMPMLSGGGFFVVDRSHKVIVPPRDRQSLYQNYYKIYPVNSEGIGKCFEVTKVIDLDSGRILNRFHMYKYEGITYFFDKKGILSEKGYSNKESEILIFAMDKDYMANEKVFIRDWVDKSFFYTSKYKPVLKWKTDRFDIVEFNEYNDVYLLSLGKFIVSKLDASGSIKYGMVNIDKKVLIPFEYEKISTGVSNILLAKKGGKWGLVTYDNEPVLPFEYEKIIGGVHNRLLLRKGEKWGLVSYDNKPILPFEYDSLEVNLTGVIAQKNGKYGFIDWTGKLIVPFIDKEITQYKHWGMLFSKDDEERVMIIKGNIQSK